MSTSFKPLKLLMFIVAGIILAAAAVLVSCMLGSSGMDIGTALGILLSRVPLLGRLIEPAPSDTQVLIVLGLRLPRALGAFAVGGALAVCGASLQGMFKNPLADSGILGISSGAGLGAGLAVILGVQRTALGLSGVSVFAFAGGAVCMLLVYLLARVRGRVSTVSLLLAGTATSTFAAAMLALLMMLNHEKMTVIYSWTMGSVAAIGWKQLGWCLPFIAAGAALLAMHSRELNIMLMGEEDARHLGVNTGAVKLRIMILSAFVCAAAVSVSGTIGFVGLMVPHAVRMFTGPDHRYVIPISFFAGGIYLVAVDLIAKTIAMPLEMPIGVITSALGGPFFIYILRKKGAV